jgi:hypothetical protein
VAVPDAGGMNVQRGVPSDRRLTHKSPALSGGNGYLSWKRVVLGATRGSVNSSESREILGRMLFA